MSSFSGTVIYTKKGLMAAEAFIRMSLAKNPSVVTVSCVQGKEFVTEGIEKPTFEDIMTAQEMVKDYDAVMHMNSYPENFPEDSAQPFFLFEEAGKPQGLLFLDGQFDNYHEAKSAHSPDFFAYQKYFNTKFSKWYKKGGLEQVKEELRDVDTQYDLKNSLLARGNVMVFLITGELFHIQKGNQEYAQFPWGYVTNSYGYKEEAKTSVPQAGKLNNPGRRMLFKRSGDTAAAPAIKPEEGEPAKEASKSPAETPHKEPPKQEEKKPETRTDTTQPRVPMSEIEWKPTITLGATREQKQAAYNECPFIAEWRDKSKKHYPEGYKQGRSITMSVPTEKLAEYIALGAIPRTALGHQLAKDTVKKLAAVGTNKLPQSKVEENRANKDVTTHNIPTPTEDSNKHAKHGYREFDTKAAKDPATSMAKHAVEVAEPKVRQWFDDAVKNKFIDQASQEIPFDPRTIQGLENSIRKATADAGLDGLEDVLRLSRTALFDLNRSHFEWFTDLFVELRHAYIKTLTKEDRPQPQDHVKTPEVQQTSSKKTTIRMPLRKAS